MREFLSAHQIPFVDRNIRGDQSARAELAERTDALVVPQLFWRDVHIIGFDPEALATLAAAITAEPA